MSLSITKPAMCADQPALMLHVDDEDSSPPACSINASKDTAHTDFCDQNEFDVQADSSIS